MNLPPAGPRGPLVAWGGSFPAVTGVDYTDVDRVTVTVKRPLPLLDLEWDTVDGSLTITTQTATSLVVQHVFESDGSDFPWEEVDGNDISITYKTKATVYVGGDPLDFPIECKEYGNPDKCNNCESCED